MKTYLFDFDGTLVDSMPVFGGLMLKILNEHGIKYGDDVLKTITPLGYVATAKYFISMGLNKTEEELVALMKEYAVYEYTNTVPAKNNVEKVLKELKSRGDSLNILTASPHDLLDPCLKRLGLYELFDNVWSCEDFQTTKSDPEIYRRAAEKIGVPVNEMIFLDDNYNADKTAKEAGAIVYGVFDQTSAEYSQEIRAVTDKYVTNFIELLDE